MERNGDVVAEINACSSLNCALIGNCFGTAKYKMCKDDIVAPLFCSTPNHLKNGLIMGSQNLSPSNYLNSDENSIDLNFFSPRNGVHGEAHCIPIIERSNDGICDSPTWEKPPALKSFSPISKEIDKSYVQDSFLNGHKIDISQNNKTSAETDSILLKALTSSDLNNCVSLDEKLQLDYEAETSSSSYEDAYASVNKDCEPANSQMLKSEATDTVHNQKSNNSMIVSSSEPDLKNNENLLVNSDRVMPELFPTLICLDDDSVSSEHNKKSYEVIDVVESPEMPTLIPFTSEVDEAFHIKTEVVSDCESRHQDSDSKDSTEAAHQPQVILERLNINDSILPSEKKLAAILSTPIKQESLNNFVEIPEIEEIEGVRFFQFHSKQDMEEFHKRSHSLFSESLSMLNEIIPTKTFDITQIKGWRTKYFAPDYDFNPKSLAFDGTTPENAPNQNVSADQTEESQNNDNYNNQQNRSSEINDLTPSNTPLKSESNNSQNKTNDCGSSMSDQNDEKFDLKKVKIEKVDKISSPKSAFISSELDEYLSNSSKLNISFLQKINPNITPISPDAPILSIGKLRKKDGPTLPLSLIFKRKRELITLEKTESDTLDSVISVPDTPESTSVTILSSAESSNSSSDNEGLPVSKLKSTKSPPVAKKRNFTNKAVKRKNLSEDLEQVSKRVVLRLKKDGDGVSKGYKVSGISCKTDNPESSSPDVSFDSIIIPEDGSLPIIKQTLFGKKNEPKLLEEFLNNLNMYGTRKDVAMLVQSNQSYFNEGPTLSPQSCTAAVSVLVSNKGFMDLKLKSKKKLKTWQKYLPKKLTEKQILKIKRTRVRKTRIQSLLDDAENIISEERKKRSIRLPARYLDSAVLAAGSEWVSPLLHIEDNPSLKKAKNVSLEAVDNKTEPVKLVELLSEDSIKESECIVKQVESPSKILDTNAVAETSVTPSLKSPVKRKKSTEPIPKKKHSKGMIKSLFDSSVSDSDVGTSSSCSSFDSTSNVIRHLLPKCCGHTSRTAVFDIHTKSFYCLKCAIKVLGEENAAKTKKKVVRQEKSAPAGAKTFVAKCNLEYKKPKIIPENEHTSTALNENMHSDFVNELSVNKSIPESSIMNLSTNVNISSPSPTSSAILSPTQYNSEKTDSPVLSKQDSGLVLVNESTNNLTNVSAAGVAGKNVVYVFMSPEQAKKKLGLSSVPILPKNDLLQNKILPSHLKPKPAILGHKFVGDSSSNVSCSNASQSSANVNMPLPYNVPSNNSAALRLSNLNQKHLLALSQSKSPPIMNIVERKDDENNSTMSPSNAVSKDPKKVVAAYKVGDSVFLYNTLLQTSVVPGASPRTATTTQSKMPIITSVQPAADSDNNEKARNYQLSHKGLTKCPSSVPSTKELNFSLASASNQLQEMPQGDHSYNRIKPKQKRKKTPISKKFCDSSEDEQFVDVKENDKNGEESEIDIETVDDSCRKMHPQIKGSSESDSELSDTGCATIYKSTTEKLSKMYGQKSMQERNRRMAMKKEFENLKASSESFKDAATIQEILNMALHVVETAKDTDQVLTLAKKRLEIHNIMLLKKLMVMLEGIQPLNTRNKIKTQIIKDLALGRQKSKNIKPSFSSPSVAKQQKGTPISSMRVEGDKLVSDAPDMEIIQEEAKKVATSPQEECVIKPDFEIKLPYQDPYSEFNIQCHEKLDSTTFVTPLKKRKHQNPTSCEFAHARSLQSQVTYLSQSKDGTPSVKANLSASCGKTNNQSKDFSTPEIIISHEVIDISNISSEKDGTQSENLNEFSSSETLKLISPNNDAKVQENDPVSLTVLKEPAFQGGCASLPSVVDNSCNVEGSSSKDVAPKSVDPPPLTPKCYELKRLLQSRLSSKSLDSVSGETETASKSKNDDLKGAAGKLEICEMRKKVKSSLQKAVVETRKTSDSDSESSESESDSSSSSSVRKQRIKRLKTVLKSVAAKLEYTVIRRKVLNSLQKKSNSGAESSDSDTEALDSEVSSDSSSSSDSIEICDDKSNENLSTSKASSENSTPDNSNQTDAQKSSKEESYPGLIPLFHPKVFHENVNKPSAFTPSQSQSQTLRESSRHVPSLGSLSLQQAAKNRSPSSNEPKEEENDDIEIVGSKIVNPFSASAKVIRTISNSKEDQPKTSLGTKEYFQSCSVQKVQLQNGVTMFAYQPETTSLAPQPDASASTPVNLNKNSIGQTKKQLPPEEIVLSDSEDENQDTVSKPSTYSNNEQILSKSPLSHVPRAPQTIEMPSNSGTVQQEQSDLSDSDDDRMHIDESCTNDAENL